MELVDTTPPIWRLIELPSTIALDALHPIVQTAMGWTDSHLHQFVLGDPQVDWPVERYLTAFDIEEGDVGVAEADVRLDELVQQPGDELRYTYDFGDGWDHVLRLQSVRTRSDDDPPAALIDGARACPPEDCGGPYGYEELLGLAARKAAGQKVEPEEAERLSLAFGDTGTEEIRVGAERLDKAAIDADLRAGRYRGVLAGELSEEHAASLGPDLLALVSGSPPDLATIAPALADLVARCEPNTRQLLLSLIAAARVDSAVVVDAQVAATMVEPFAWFVRHVGTRGLTLTAQGYLRPSDVRAIAERLNLGEEWIGAMNRETMTPPVAEFRQVAQQLGLMRVAKGRIHATARGVALAENPTAMWWQLAERLPAGRRDAEREAGFLVLLTVAAGADRSSRVDLGRLLTGLGWQLRSGRTLDDSTVWAWAITTTEALRRLGCFDPSAGHHSTTPTAAGRAFARAALRTHPT